MNYWAVYTHALDPNGGNRWLIGRTRWDDKQGPISQSYKIVGAVTGTEADAKALAAECQRSYDRIRASIVV